ncbi:demethylmenaquinone methyltransferase/2-methoxy-6-polyprenyl-1,4-benzoquinol methylase [Kribbella steppae]|uniref:Demethylmenaquinone methyltransferase/2-methoxy-6-polyprenyl-1,4-benzoquinol methylase n=1 Tax=Kribbella steppae TaxID=2512223 RepID=A0A4R2HP13_9ACTN|nr:class I SAM-dependent methyltransferase [Kribbella steppae]TCO32894.1 demethylmenaquinone methyltransferase/2-methoxy-6-polyprenyl-1,4-benzoquinol methylase [Kribbella steppae]
MDEFLAEQIAYYQARAGEYDEWWLRRGRYALPSDLERAWFEDVAEAEAALRSFAPTGWVLELACGTGLWTQHLVGYADHVTAVDASPEVIELNRERLGGAPVDHVVADVFEWQPPAASYDVAVFTYWLSHVPDNRLDAFWSNVRTALRPGGRVFLVDSSPYPPDSAPPTGGRPQRRELNDGRTFTISKRYWTGPELEADLRRRGWDATARVTTNQMILVATASA